MHGRAVNLFCVGQHSLLRIQTLVFARLDFRFIDFALLKCPQVHQAQLFLLTVLQFVDTRLDLLPFVKTLP